MSTVKNRIWNEEFDDLAAHEGWNVFNVQNLRERDYLAIQRIDDPGSYSWYPEDGDGEPRFPNDKAAIAFVRRQAKKGKPHAVLALELVKGEVKRAGRKVI